MAKIVDPRNLPPRKVPIPGLKPPVQRSIGSDAGDPAEVDAFIQMIRELRHQGSDAAPSGK